MENMRNQVIEDEKENKFLSIPSFPFTVCDL